MYIIILLSTGFALVCSSEINDTRRYYHSTAAFWLAEAGANMYMKDPTMLDNTPSRQITYGNGTIYLSKDDSRPAFRSIYSTGTYGGTQRKIRITYLAGVPEVYKNVLSTSGNVSINGDRTTAVFNGQALVSGEVNGSSENADVFFENIAKSPDNSFTSLNFNNSQNFDDRSLENFTNNMGQMVSGYPPDQVLHVQDNNYTLSADSVDGKQIVYVDGNVTINSNLLVKSGQNVTIIASGTVTFNQSGDQAPNSQLNIIAWGGYNETVSAPSTYRGLIYTHGVATFDNIKYPSVTNGGVIADGGVVLGEIWSTKIFNYADMTTNDLYPPGFEQLTGASTSTVAVKPIAWKEIGR